MATRIKSLKSTFAFLFVISFLYTWNAQAAELPAVAKAQLHQIIGKLENAGAQVGLEIDDLGTVKNPQQFPAQNNGATKVLFSYRATQSYMSASNWKLFTAFYALDSKVPDNARDTEIVSNAYIDKEGILKDGLYLVGHGDPSLNVGQLQHAAQQLKAMGLRQLKYDQVGVIYNRVGETFAGRYPFGWTLDDTLWYYAPELTTLSMNRNQVDVIIIGGKKQGDPATVTFSPNFPDLEIQANVLTGQDVGVPYDPDTFLMWDRYDKYQKGIDLRGQVAPGQKVVQGIALNKPALMAGKVFAEQLRKVGLEVRDAVDFMAPGSPKRLLTIPAPPLKVLLTRMLKRSDNFYAEMILRTSSRFGTAATADEVRGDLFVLLKKNGINTSGLRMEDGSGLSRYSLITPQAMTQLLNAAQKLPHDKADIFWNALPIAGVDGTLGKRMKSTFAQNNVRAKTGTFNTACNLSGYVTTRDGHRLAVSFLTNFGPETDVCRAAQNRVFESLAGGTLK